MVQATSWTYKYYIYKGKTVPMQIKINNQLLLNTPKYQF
jgi:hypothetical protein